MKKLYRKGAVHPSPPITADHLSFLPAAIFSLAAALSPEDKEVLAYLIYRSDVNLLSDLGSGYRVPANRNMVKTGKGGGGGNRDHPPYFSCDCFRCYMSYWVRWDLSPNRQLIHEIIDAFEESLAESKRPKGRREKKRRGVTGGESKRQELLGLKEGNSGELNSVDDPSAVCGGGGVSEGSIDDIEDGEQKGSVGRFVSFIGERLWGTVWG